MESSLTENYFWFPEFAGAKFEGKIEKGEFVTINLESSSLEQSVNIEKVLKNHEIVIHGLHNSIPATFIVMLIYKKENFGFLNNNYLLVLNFRILFSYYGYHFNRIEDIKFNSLIVAFKGLQRWISYDDSIYVFKSKENKNTLRLGGKLIDIYYRSPITARDREISSKPNGRVIYVEIKSPNRMKFKELLDIKSIIQDFFNFFITGESVVTNSVYGTIINNSKSNIITIEYKSPINELMNKSRIRSPVLITYPEVHANLETLIKKFSRFRKIAKTAYNYYFSEMYQGNLPLELRFFLLAGFLESYHAKFFSSKSIKGKQNEQELQTILPDLSTANLQGKNKRIIKMVLKDHYKRIRLVDRLREIFNEYKYLLLLNIPILSYISEQQLELSINKLILDKTTKNQILNTIKNKKKLDLNIMEGNEKYKVIIEDLLNKKNAGVRKKIVEYALSQSTNYFPQEISKLRNMIAHVKEEFNAVEFDIWVLSVWTLELIGLLCILTRLGFRKRQISNIILLHKISFREEIKTIIESSIWW